MYFEYVTQAEQAQESLKELLKSKQLAFDTETCPWPVEGPKRLAFNNVYNLTPDDEPAAFDPHTCSVRLLQLKGENTKVYVWDLWRLGELSRDLVSALAEGLSKDAVLIAHNIKFDLKMLAGAQGVWLDVNAQPFDTQQASRLIANAVGLGNERRHRLKDLSRDFLGVDLDKTSQASDWSKTELSQIQLDYAAADVLYLHQLYELLKNGLEKDYDMKDALKLEMECLGPTARMEFNGVPINLSVYRKVQEAAQYAMPTLLGQIGHYFKQEINQTLSLTYVPIKDFASGKETYKPFMLPWGGGKAGKDFLMSRANLVKEMIQKLGLVDEKGEPLETTEKAALTGYRTTHEGVAQLLDYWNLVKQAQFEYDKYAHVLTGCLHPGFQAGGASTGRFSCTRPNLKL